jgi:uncharacterized coiled-coil protein SlyX
VKLPALSLIQNVTLVALSVVSVCLGMQVSALTSEVQKHPSNEQLTSVQEHVDRIDSELDDLRKTSVASFEDWQERDQETRGRLEELSQMSEQSTNVEALLHDLAEMSAEMQNMQAQMQALNAAINNRSTSAPASQSVGKPPASSQKTRANKKASPPFNTLAVESRGGELFLAVSPVGSTNLNDVELLRPSRTFMGWRLNTLAPSEAHFGHPDGSTFTAQVR